MTCTFLSPLHYWLADIQAPPASIVESSHRNIPYYLGSFFRLVTNYNIFKNVEILKGNVLFQDFFSVKENIELSGTIFEAKNSKLINYLTNMC
jgi:hypothetical protein